MSVAYNTSAVTNNIALCLDASNKKCGSSNVFLEVGNSGFGSTADNVALFDVNGSGTFYRLGYGQTFGGYTIQPEDVVYKLTLGSSGYFYHGYRATFNAGIRYTFTFDYYISPDATNLGVAGNQTLLANIENYGSGVAGGGVSLPNTSLGIWQTVSFTSGLTTTLGQTALFLYPGANGKIADSGYLLYKNPRVFIDNTSTSIPFSSSKTINKTDLVSNLTALPSNGCWQSSLNGGYYNFDGVDDKITFTTPTNNSQSQSYEVWCSVSLPAGNDGYGYILHNNSADFSLGASAFAIGIKPTNTYFGAFNGAFSTMDSGVTASQSTVVQIVITWDGATQKLYMNGQLVDSQALTGTLQNLSTTTSIGNYAASNSRPVQGKIYAVRSYTKALSDSEVAQNFVSLRGRYGL